SGMRRLERIYEPDGGLDLDGLSDADPGTLVERVADVLEEGAADGAILIEVRFGGNQLLRPDLMPLFREAERRVRQRHPGLHAEAIGYLGLIDDPGRLLVEERRLEACLRAAADGLGGVDFRVDPYDSEA